MNTRRALTAIGLAGVLCTGAAADWVFGPSVLIDPYGDNPSVGNGTVAYVHTTTSSIHLFDGSNSVPVYDSSLYCFAPVNVNGIIAWRTSSGTVNTNEIYYTDGVEVENLTNSPGVSDAEVSVGTNGDMIWSVQFTSLYYYDASENRISSLNVHGRYPSLWIREDGVVTYAYQDPDTYEVKYRVGSETSVLGPGLGQGTDLKARPSLRNGVVAWIGPGAAGDSFTAGEVFVLVDDQVLRLTNDDAVGGRADDFPSAWRGAVVWQRSPNSATQTRIFFWDGEQIQQLTTTRTAYPSFNHGQVAWVDWTSGLHVAPLAPPIEPGDCDNDGEHTFADVEAVLACLGGPEVPLAAGCVCGDYDLDTDSDMHDLAQFAAEFVENGLHD